MVELYRFPVAFHVAGFAFLAVSPFMLVDLDMTTHAFKRCFFILARRDMAFAAFHVQVLALEREMGLFERVIEFCLFPGTLVMAAFAIGTQTALMLVILVMAVIACRRRFTIFFLRCMTIRTLYLFLVLVRPQQREIGLGVIEFCRIQYDDLRISSFMFGMAGAAYFFIKSAMESLMILDIRFHVLVAVCTQPALRFLIKANVAFLAVGFEFGVSCDHFTRHQCGLARPECDAGE